MNHVKAKTAPNSTPTRGNEAEVAERLRHAEALIQEYWSTFEAGGPPAALAEPPQEPTTDLEPAVAELELSVVMPCLNEADTLATCIQKAQRAMQAAGIAGEVVVADNGSTDRSIEIAESLGARVVHVEAKGYGNALMGGIESAKGRYIIMGDADDSYDFMEIPKFVEKLREGHALVQGCRLPWGGGKVLPGAMPLLHRWWGNPMFTAMVRNMFGAPVHDVYCGLRGFTREHYDQLSLRCTGMEFATEMIIKSSLFGSDIAEVPTTLHPDGRKAHAPHLRTFRDGWRTLRFFLMYSPRWCFFVPGMVLALAGLLGYCLAVPGVQVMGATLDAHTLLVASLVLMVGTQLVQFGLFAKTFAISEGLLPESPRMQWFRRTATLERGLALGFAGAIAGGGLILAAVEQWRAAQFGPLDYAVTMRWVIPGVTLAALGCQTMFASFFLSVLRMARR